MAPLRDEGETGGEVESRRHPLRHPPRAGGGDELDPAQRPRDPAVVGELTGAPKALAP